MAAAAVRMLLTKKFISSQVPTTKSDNIGRVRIALTSPLGWRWGEGQPYGFTLFTARIPSALRPVRQDAGAFCIARPPQARIHHTEVGGGLREDVALLTPEVLLPLKGHAVGDRLAITNCSTLGEGLAAVGCPIAIMALEGLGRHVALAPCESRVTV